MNLPKEVDIRLIDSMDYQASTITSTGHKGKSGNTIHILIHKGLFYILSEEELKTVIAHEIGHHLAPKTKIRILSEYWADNYACKYYNPVAYVNALIKIDQNTFFQNIFLERCNHLIRMLLPHQQINNFNEFILKNARTYFTSKRDANKEAKKLIREFSSKENIQLLKPRIFKRIWIKISRKNQNQLQRKELSKLKFINWEFYDNRIRNNYLDKYELINIYKIIKIERMTINRFHIKDLPEATHPIIKRRLKFIIENFILE